MIAILFLGLMDLINRQIPEKQNFDEFISKQKTWLRWIIYIVLAEAIIRFIHVFENNAAILILGYPSRILYKNAICR